MARQTAYHRVRARAAGFYRRRDDDTVLQQIRAVTNRRATYGYRRVWAMVNRTFRASDNRKRIRRLLRMHGLMLPPRVHRRHGRPHLGQVQQPASNQRWCSDVFLIPCWSGEVLSVAFAIDCHDREVFVWTASPRPLTGADIRMLMDKALWARFGETAVTTPHAIQWLSDNGPQYTATASVLYAHELGLCPSRRQRTARRATGSPRPLCTRSNATTSTGLSCAMPNRCSRNWTSGLRTTTAKRRIRRSACGARPSTGRASNSRPHPSSELGSRPPCWSSRPRERVSEAVRMEVGRASLP